MNHVNKKQQGFLATVKEIASLLLIVFIIRTVGFGLYQVPTGSMEPTMLVGERFFADKLTYWFTKPKHNDIIATNDPLHPYSDNTFVRLFQEYVWGPTNWTKRVIGVPGDHLKGTIEDGKPVVYRNGEKLDEPYVNPYPLITVFRTDIDQLQAMIKRGARPEDIFAEYVVIKTFDPSRPFNEQIYYPVTINKNRIVREMPLIQPGTPINPQAEISQLPDDRNYWTNSDIFNVHLGPNEYWVMGDNRLGSKDSRFFGPLKGNLIHGRILWRIWSCDSDESWWIIDMIKHPIDFWKKIRWNRFFQRVR